MWSRACLKDKKRFAPFTGDNSVKGVFGLQWNHECTLNCQINAHNCNKKNEKRCERETNYKNMQNIAKLCWQMEDGCYNEHINKKQTQIF